MLHAFMGLYARVYVYARAYMFMLARMTSACVPYRIVPEGDGRVGAGRKIR